MRNRFFIPLAMGLAVFILAGAVYMAGLPFLELMQLKVEDALFLARGPLPAQSGKVVVVSIGERSLDEQGALALVPPQDGRADLGNQRPGGQMHRPGHGLFRARAGHSH